MSETKKRNTHLPEFKAKVGLEAVRGAKTVNEIAQPIFNTPKKTSLKINNLERTRFQSVIFSVFFRVKRSVSCSLPVRR